MSRLRICRGSHLKLERISILPHGVLQPASSAFLCCTLTTCLMKFPSHPFPSSNPPFQSWVFPPPGSLPVPTAQVFLDLLLHITHFFSIIPQLFSALTSLPGNMQWPCRQPLLYVSFCAPPPSQPWWESARPQPGSLCLLLLPKGHPF